MSDEPDTDSTGTVEVDETYVGGKHRNMSYTKLKTMISFDPVAMTPVVGIVDRPTNHVSAKVIERTDADALQGFVIQHSESNAIVYTVEATANKSLPLPHESVRHSISQYVSETVHNKGIVLSWSL